MKCIKKDPYLKVSVFVDGYINKINGKTKNQLLMKQFSLFFLYKENCLRLKFTIEFNKSFISFLKSINNPRKPLVKIINPKLECGFAPIMKDFAKRLVVEKPKLFVTSNIFDV